MTLINGLNVINAEYGEKLKDRSDKLKALSVKILGKLVILEKKFRKTI